MRARVLLRPRSGRWPRCSPGGMADVLGAEVTYAAVDRVGMESAGAAGQVFFLPVRAIAPAAGAITSHSPIVTTMDVI